MPTPKHSHLIGLKIYGLDSATLEGATVTISLNSDSSTAISNAKGEAVLNTGDFSDGWNAGDEITISANKDGVGETSTTLVLTDKGGQKLDLTLEPTSNLIYHDDGTNQFVLNFALLVDEAGNKITASNPLPVSDTPPPKNIRYDANDAAPNYIGINYSSFEATTSSRTWTIYKLTYSGSDVTQIQRRGDVAWDDRTTLF